MKRVIMMAALATMSLTGCATTAITPQEVDSEYTYTLSNPATEDYRHLKVDVERPVKLPPRCLTYHGMRRSSGVYKNELAPCISAMDNYAIYYRRYMKELYRKQQDYSESQRQCLFDKVTLPKPRPMPQISPDELNIPDDKLSTLLVKYINELSKWNTLTVADYRQAITSFNDNCR